MSLRHEQGWGDLPLDVLSRIGRSLTSLGQDIGAMRAVCKRWKQGVSIVPVSLQPSSPPWHYAAFPRTVAVDVGARGKGRSLCQQELKVLSHPATVPTFRQSLTALALDRCAITDALLLSALETLPFLEDLSLNGCCFLRGEFLLEASNARNSKNAANPHIALKRLSMTDCSINFHLPPLSTAVSDEGQGPGLFAPFAPNLQVLDLGGNPLGDELIMRSVSELDRLQVLGLRCARFLTSQGLASLCARCLDIHTLDLDECWTLTEDAEETWQVLLKFRALQTLIFPLSSPPTKLPPLTSLYLTSNPAISNSTSYLKLFLSTICKHGCKFLPAIKTMHCSIAPGKRVSTCFSTVHRDSGGVSFWRRIDAVPRNCAQPSPLGLRFNARELSSAVTALRRAQFEMLMDLSLPSCGLPLEVATVLLQAAPGLTALDFSRNSFCRTRTQVNTDFAAALGSLKRLRFLNLSGCGLSDHGMSTMFSNPRCGLTSLTSLNLADNKNLTDQTIHRLLCEMCTMDGGDLNSNLKSLDVYGTSISLNSLLACPPGMTHLGFGGANMVKVKKEHAQDETGNDVGLEQLFMRLPKLLSLEIADYDALNRMEFMTLASVLTSLTQLSLRGSRLCTDWEGPQDLSALRLLTRLKALDLSRCVFSLENGHVQSIVSDESLEALGQLPWLSTLRVADSSHITPAGIQTITKRMPSLAYLDLTCCLGLFQGQVKEDQDLLYETVPKALVDRAVVCLPQGTILSDRHSCWVRSEK